MNTSREQWSRGFITPFWQDDYKSLDYFRMPAPEKDVETWRARGYTKDINFTGKAYDNSNPMPEWTERFKNIFQLANMSFTFYKMQTLDIMPVHYDAFEKYTQMNECEFMDVRRVLVMLEDWKPGHYFEIAGQGFTNWKAGDWFMWRGDVHHSAANIGLEDRYSLQITGIDYAITDNWQHLHWLNFTDLPTKRDTLKSARIQELDKMINGNRGVPYYIYFYNGRIHDLENIKHSMEVADQLNRTGVDIYLYEPLCSYDELAEPYYPPIGNKMSMQFYSEFKDEVIEHRARFRAAELDSIEKYIINNHLTKVRVHTCDFEVEKYYISYEHLMEIDTFDLFLRAFDVSEFEPLAEDEVTNQFTKKFVCMNWRWTPHRQLIAAYLAAKDDSYLSWYFKSSLQNFMVEPWYNLKEIRERDEIFYSILLKGLRNLKDNGPFCLDFKVDEAVTIGHPYFREVLPKSSIQDCKTQVGHVKMDVVKNIYNDIFCDIVTETRFAQPTANISEKTLRAIYYKKPFVLVGPPNSLTYLRELGFKTFGKLWDEGYDLIENHEERFFKVIEVISHLESESIETLRERYDSVKEILEFNREHLLKLLDKNKE